MYLIELFTEKCKANLTLEEWFDIMGNVIIKNIYNNSWNSSYYIVDPYFIVAQIKKGRGDSNEENLFFNASNNDVVIIVDDLFHKCFCSWAWDSN